MSIPRRSRLLRKFTALILGMGLSAGTSLNMAWSQVPQAPERTPERPKAARTFINKLNFHLPLLMDENAKSQLKEVHLFVKDNPNGQWVLVEKGSPRQSGFNFTAPREGEYFFTMAMIDRQGKTISADQFGSGLTVVVDMQPPQVGVQSLNAGPDGQQVQVEVGDANMDPAKIQFYYQTRDQVWRTLDSLPTQPGRYCVPAQAAWTGMVRVAATDLAGNTTRRDVNLTTTAQNTPPIPPPVNPALTVQESIEKAVLPAPLPIPALPSAPEKVPVVTVLPHPPGSSSEQSIALPVGPDVVKASLPPDLPPIPPVTTEKTVPVTTTTTVKREALTSNRRLINQTQLLLEYQLDQVGASGVGKVEVWLTNDQGKSWKKIGDDPDCKSPVAVELPGEGLFGVNLVVSNGRGFGATPPKAGDEPDSWVEVDQAKPTVELTGIRPGSGEDAGALFISWTAQDKNPAPEGVELSYASSREGPWQPIAKGQKFEGRYRWLPPASLGSQVFIRLVARDLAGNTAQVDTPQPVLLDDQSRPRGRLLSIAPFNPSAQLEPRGN